MRLLVLLSFLALVAVSYQQTSSSNSTTTTATTTTTTTAATTTKCTINCSSTYNPVCATYKGRRITFLNRCTWRANRRCARKKGTLSKVGLRFIKTGACNARRRIIRRRVVRRRSTSG
ncbi:protein new-glue 1-like [Rhagoletis pomonella]|uniref:protein new-glue 1-like n=1 Tax=Rhagoletis pomonella TaxID=28610 RepID=UPI00177EC1D3|nr:protein new-glue 1-like [Rhagoletis pomonella]